MTFGFGWAFAANAVSFLVFAVCLVLAGQDTAKLVPVASKRKKSKLKDGFVLARHDWRIAILLLMVAAVTIADDPILVLGPALASHLHAAQSWSGWFIAALGAGTCSGGCGHPGTTRRSSWRLGPTALAACMMWFVLSPWVWGSVAAASAPGSPA